MSSTQILILVTVSNYHYRKVGLLIRSHNFSDSLKYKLIRFVNPNFKYFKNTFLEYKYSLIEKCKISLGYGWKIEEGHTRYF